MQRTTFPYELVIGEDCSTDGTREIVLDYAHKYPDIIQVITSETNVGGMANLLRTFSACQGEYIAACEGDDYWIDPLKLQKQYEAILKYDAALVLHSTFFIRFPDICKLLRASDGSGYLEFDDILRRKLKYHTSSFFFNSKIARNLPEWFYQLSVGDYPFTIIAAYSGKVYYIDDPMSVYIKGNKGSYTFQKSEESKNIGFKDYLKFYFNFDKYANYQFSDIIQECIRQRLLYFIDTFGNLDFLEMSEFQKKRLKLILILTSSCSPAVRTNILRKMVDQIHLSKDILSAVVQK